jgi:hypothetical protein
MYQLLPNDTLTGQPTQSIKRLSDGAFIPLNLPANSDYRTYLKWLDGYEPQFNSETHQTEWVKTSDGNTPLPADE